MISDYYRARDFTKTQRKIWLYFIKDIKIYIYIYISRFSGFVTFHGYYLLNMASSCCFISFIPLNNVTEDNINKAKETDGA